MLEKEIPNYVEADDLDARRKKLPQADVDKFADFTHVPMSGSERDYRDSSSSREELLGFIARMEAVESNIRLGAPVGFSAEEVIRQMIEKYNESTDYEIPIDSSVEHLKTLIN